MQSPMAIGRAGTQMNLVTSLLDVTVEVSCCRVCNGTAGKSSILEIGTLLKAQEKGQE